MTRLVSRLEVGRHHRGVVEAIGIVALYVALDRMSHLQPFDSAGTTPWNPPPGLSLFLLLRRGRPMVSVLFVAAFSSEFFVRGPDTTLARATASATLSTAGYALLADALSKRFGGEPDFRRVADVASFTAIVGVAVALIGALSIAIHAFLGPATSLDLGRQWLQFWVGDVIGILVFTPALCVHWSNPRRLPIRPLELTAQIALTAIVLGALWTSDPVRAPQLFYLLFLPLVWIAIRANIEGATLALVAIQFGLIAGLQIVGHNSELVLELELLMSTLVVTGLLLGASVSAWRTTEQSLRERQAELDESLRLAAASATASALAHELNQPLTAVLGFLGAARTMIGSPSLALDRLEGAILGASREAARAGDIVRRLREFFRSGAKSLERISVRDLIRDSIAGLESSCRRHGIGIEVDCRASVGAVLVDRLQLETVMHLLLQNSIESIVSHASEDRSIEIRARSQSAEVTIEIRDSGPGVDPRVQDSVFSPFTTTKPLGTGLGLSIGRAIVEDHGGRLEYLPSEGGGLFQVVLPRTDENRSASA